MKKPPLRLVKDSFQSKEKLVEAVQKLATSELWIDRVSPAKGLGRVANGKLVRLHTILTDAKKRFGSREKLITAILELEKRLKDAGYRQRLEQYPLPRLIDAHAAADRRAAKAHKAKAPAVAKKAAKKPAAAVAKPAKKASSKKASSKKAPAKKTPSKRPSKRA
jgi:hypothetical protein